MKYFIETRDKDNCGELKTDASICIGDKIVADGKSIPRKVIDIIHSSDKTILIISIQSKKEIEIEVI